MSHNVVQNINQLKAGACPHGLPPGACPVCSTTGGGSRLSDRNRNVGEMTYQECLAIWNNMKAQAKAKEHYVKTTTSRLQALKNFEETLIKASEKIAAFVQKYSNNIIARPITLATKLLILPILKFIQIIPKIFTKFIPDITDKLNAMFGETKAFLEKKISDALNQIKSSIIGLFKVFKKKNAEDDDTKIDEDKKIFNFKTILLKIKEKIKNKKDKKDEHGSQT